MEKVVLPVALGGALETNNWSASYEPHGEVDSIVDCVSLYIMFYMDNNIPTNLAAVTQKKNKPWVTSDLKAFFNRKKRAFRAG